MNKAIRTTAKGIHFVLIQYLGIFLVVLFLASAVDVINRILFGFSLAWSHDLSVWAMAVIGFSCTGPVTMEHTHINVSFLFDKTKGMIHKIFSLSFTALEIIFASMVFYAGIDVVISLYERGITTLLGEWSISRWLIYFLSVFVGMFFAVIYGIITFVRDLRAPAQAAEK